MLWSPDKCQVASQHCHGSTKLPALALSPLTVGVTVIGGRYVSVVGGSSAPACCGSCSHCFFPALLGTPSGEFPWEAGPRQGAHGGALPTGTSPFLDALTANGTTSSLQTSVAGVAAGKRKFLEERREQPFDKRLRFSVRQTESAYRYRDIVVRKQDGFTHILLSTKSSENNSLNPEVSH